MGKREAIKRKRKEMEKRNNLTIIFIVAAFVIVVVGMIILTQYKPPAKVTVPQREKAQITEGLTMGDPNAKVKIVEFADFQCPACASYWSSMEPTMIKTYVDTGKVFFRYSPFSFLGYGQTWDESVKAAEAAYCANDQQKFWEYHDIIFANHNGENQGAYSKNNLIAFANEIGLDLNQFKECFNSGKYSQQVTDDNAYAEAQGATFTPSFLVDGKVVSANDLVQAIEDALAK